MTTGVCSWVLTALGKLSRGSMSTLQMCPKVAISVAQHEVTNLLRVLDLFLYLCPPSERAASGRHRPPVIAEVVPILPAQSSRMNFVDSAVMSQCQTVGRTWKMRGFMSFLIFTAESYYSGNEPWLHQIQQVNAGKTLKGKSTWGQPTETLAC